MSRIWGLHNFPTKNKKQTTENFLAPVTHMSFLSSCWFESTLPCRENSGSSKSDHMWRCLDMRHARTTFQKEEVIHFHGIRIYVIWFYTPDILAKTCLYTDMESNILYHPALIFNFTGHLDKNVFRQKGPFKSPRFRSRQGRKRNETATKPLADIPLHWFGSWRDPYFMAHYSRYRTG